MTEQQSTTQGPSTLRAVRVQKRTTAIIGLGISGMSCLRHLYGTDDLVVVDSREQPANLAEAQRDYPQARFFIGAQSLAPERWDNVDRIVISPGVAANDPLLAGSDALDTLSDIDLFIAATNSPIIGVTGTNGKSTVTALVGHVLDEFGLNVGVGGNLGEPALDLLSSDRDVYVLELSSFQIEHSGVLPLAAATVLNLSVDHLDRHGSLAHYGAIKRRVYAAAEMCIVNADDVHTHTEGGAPGLSFGTSTTADWSLLDGETLRFCGATFASAADFAISGQHNLLNVLAALALVAALAPSANTAGGLPGLPPFVGHQAEYVSAAASFKGLEHRAELVRELSGVCYVNDSKATNVGACVAALVGFPRVCASSTQEPRVVLLAGGQSKGADFTPLGQAAAGRVKAALLFGEDANLLAAALSDHTAVEFSSTLGDALERAQQLACAGDTVLLAPACASFDMFSSFTARGNAFRKLVEALA